MNKSLTSREFVQKVFIEETGRLVHNGFYHFAFVIMAQGIETLGSFLDNKPLKARDQSKLRFSHAINKLMPLEYTKLNHKKALYEQLRASLAHTFTVSQRIYLTSGKVDEFKNKHLQIVDEKLVLVAEEFYSDFKKACERLLEGMEKKIISGKKINAKFYYSF